MHEVSKTVGAFSCAPSPSTQGLEVVSKHGVSVVEGKQGVPTPRFKFPLADYAAPAAFEGLVARLRKVKPNPARIVDALVRLKMGIGDTASLKLLKNRLKDTTSSATPQSVSCFCDCSQRAFGSNLTDIEAKDLTGLLFDRDRNRKGLTFCMFEGFHFVD